MLFNILILTTVIGLVVTVYGLISSPMIDKLTKKEKGTNPLLYVGMAIVVWSNITMYSMFPELFLKMF